MHSYTMPLKVQYLLVNKGSGSGLNKLVLTGQSI